MSWVTDLSRSIMTSSTYNNMQLMVEKYFKRPFPHRVWRTHSQNALLHHQLSFSSL